MIKTVRAYAQTMTLVGIVTANALTPHAALARSAPYYDKTRLSTIEYGLFCDQGTTTREDAPNTTLGYIENISGEVVFRNHGTIVPAQMGMNFGVKSSALGATAIDVLVRTTHPAFSVDGSTVGEWQGEISAGELTYKGFGFDFPYEMALGDWVLETYKGDILLYRVEFTVVDPKTVPWLAQMCQGDALLS